VAFESDVDYVMFERWRGYIQGVDRTLRALTENQFMISRCTLVDKSRKGDIVIEAGAEEQSVLASDADSMWKKDGKRWLTAGSIPASALGRYLVAEFLECDERNSTCSCYLNLGNWTQQGQSLLCSDKDHAGNGKSCLEKIRKEWSRSGVKFPPRDNAELPPTMFEIHDS
jgi:hypothetical protein